MTNFNLELVQLKDMQSQDTDASLSTSTTISEHIDSADSDLELQGRFYSLGSTIDSSSNDPESICITDPPATSSAPDSVSWNEELEAFKVGLSDHFEY